MLQRFYRAHRHPFFAQVGHAGVLLGLPLLQNHAEIYGMPEVSPLLVQQQLFCNGDVQSPAINSRPPGTARSMKTPSILRRLRQSRAVSAVGTRINLAPYFFTPPETAFMVA